MDQRVLSSEKQTSTREQSERQRHRFSLAKEGRSSEGGGAATFLHRRRDSQTGVAARRALLGPGVRSGSAGVWVPGVVGRAGIRL